MIPSCAFLHGTQPALLLPPGAMPTHLFSRGHAIIQSSRVQRAAFCG